MSIKVIAFVFLFLTSIGIANAYDVSIYGFEWENTCSNDTHLYRKADVYINDTLYPFNQTVACVNGCSNSTLDCRPTTMNLNMWLIVLTIVILAMIVAGVKLPMIVGLPLIVVSMVFTGYFLLTDFFTSAYTILSSYQMIIVSFIVLEIGAAFYVLQEYSKG